MAGTARNILKELSEEAEKGWAAKERQELGKPRSYVVLTRLLSTSRWRWQRDVPDCRTTVLRCSGNHVVLTEVFFFC